MEEKILLSGQMRAVLKKPNGTIEVVQNNTITNVGFDLLCDLLGSKTGRANLGFIGVGKGTVAKNPSQTALESEIIKVAATYSHKVGTAEFTLQSVLGAGVGTGAITESGVFNANAAGATMFDRTVFPVINKEASDELTVTFIFRFKEGN